MKSLKGGRNKYKMKTKNLIGKIASGIALVGTLGACAGNSGIKVDNLLGRNLNPANQRPVSEMPIEEQVYMHFGIPVQEDDFEDLVGLEKTAEGYRVVACARYIDPSISKAETFDTAAGAILQSQKKSAGTIYGLKPFKSRRIADKFCVGYTAPEQ